MEWAGPSAWSRTKVCGGGDSSVGRKQEARLSWVGGGAGEEGQGFPRECPEVTEIRMGSEGSLALPGGLVSGPFSQ